MNNIIESNNSDHAVAHLKGKYLTFALSEEQYGIDILNVIEIFGMVNITSVPRSPDFMKGVINLRGKIIPVLDLRLKFGLNEKSYDEKTCIIVVNITIGDQEVPMGIIVDTVLEVRDFNESMLAPAPDYGVSLDTNFIIGMGKFSNGDVTILIDINKIFNNADEKTLIQTTAQSEE
ncbi:MAG: purine-binding chemotaxis protein CheW [Bdellovibrionales bacterium]|nr:purine-binding chemotaxis protein CheW [Bdellovibrionales bacterium]